MLIKLKSNNLLKSHHTENSALKEMLECLFRSVMENRYNQKLRFPRTPSFQILPNLQKIPLIPV